MNQDQQIRQDRIDEIIHGEMHAARKTPFDELAQEALQLLSFQIEDLLKDTE